MLQLDDNKVEEGQKCIFSTIAASTLCSGLYYFSCNAILPGRRNASLVLTKVLLFLGLQAVVQY